MAAIKNIKVNSLLCPLVDGIRKQRNVFYSTASTVPVWSSEAPTTKFPAVLAGPELSLTLTIELETAGTFVITATLDHAPLAVLEHTTPGLTHVAIKLPVKKSPWCLQGALDWIVTDPVSKKIVPTSSVIEIYLLPGPPLPALDNVGIPLALLRLKGLFDDWAVSIETDWARFVTIALHTKLFLRYESIDGGPTYTSELTSTSGASPSGFHIPVCWLDLSLSDIQNLQERGDNTSRYKVNAFDLAAILQTLISLGSDTSKVRTKYMSPFGYLKDTKVIGRTTFDDAASLCNNPKFGYPGVAADPHVDPVLDSRSKSDVHVFLARETDSDPVIYDACYGPVTGDRSLYDYAALTLDSQKPEDTQDNGDLSNIIDGSGVATFSTNIDFGDNNVALTTKDDMIPAIISYLNGLGNVQTPIATALPGQDAAVITMTVASPRKDPADMWTINIYRYARQEAAIDAFLRRLHSSPQFQQMSSTELINHNLMGNYRMWLYQEQSFVVSIESVQNSFDELQTPLNAISKIMTDARPNHRFVAASISACPKKPVTLGENFEITLDLVTDQVKDWYRAYCATTSFGNAFLMGVDTSAKDSITLTFVARKLGTDNITILLYGASLHQQGKLSVGVNIVKSTVAASSPSGTIPAPAHPDTVATTTPTTGVNPKDKPLEKPDGAVTAIPITGDNAKDKPLNKPDEVVTVTPATNDDPKDKPSNTPIATSTSTDANSPTKEPSFPAATPANDVELNPVEAEKPNPEAIPRSPPTAEKSTERADTGSTGAAVHNSLPVTSDINGTGAVVADGGQKTSIRSSSPEKTSPAKGQRVPFRV